MKCAWTVMLAVAAVAGCKPAMSPQDVQQYQNRTLYTCCNIHYETEAVSDANYSVGTILPLGTPVRVDKAGRNSITVATSGPRLTLTQDYGKTQESFQQYTDKMLVSEDPNLRLAHWPRDVQDAVHDGRVEKGMTREQVIMSLGYPPAHRTPSTMSNEWTYWYNRWVTYRVVFGADGTVSDIAGRPAPTQDRAIHAAPPPPVKRPTMAPRKRHK